MVSAATIALPNERTSGTEARPALGTMLLRPTPFRFFCARTFTAGLRTSRLNRRVHMWIAAVVLVFSIGESQPKSSEIAAQPKQILFIHSFGPNFQQGTAWSREIQN